MQVRLAAKLGILTVMWAGAGWAQAPIQLGRPVDCVVGGTCFIQNYVDDDPGPAAADYQCGALTYNGHSGTDFRIRSMAVQKAGVNVLAAAAGRVSRVRDGVADRSIKESGREAVANIECGNGVLIEHSDGWETQYCHMAQGSLRVKPGDAVEKGQPLGQIGMSGATEFPHLHLTVRRAGQVIDPFAFGAAPQSCGGGASLWEPPLRAEFAYTQGSVLNAGFTDAPPDLAKVQDGLPAAALKRDAPAIVAYVQAIGLRKGDVQILDVRDPTGKEFVRNQARPLEKNLAQALVFAGKKRSSAWPAGAYTASYQVLRDNKVVVDRSFAFTMSAE